MKKIISIISLALLTGALQAATFAELAASVPADKDARKPVLTSIFSIAENVQTITAAFASLNGTVEYADLAPTPQAQALILKYAATILPNAENWRAFVKADRARFAKKASAELYNQALASTEFDDSIKLSLRIHKAVPDEIWALDPNLVNANQAVPYMSALEEIKKSKTDNECYWKFKKISDVWNDGKRNNTAPYLRAVELRKHYFGGQQEVEIIAPEAATNSNPTE